MKNNYFIESLRAVKYRTMPVLNLDKNPPVSEKGISWIESIYWLFYWWIKHIIRYFVNLIKSHK